MEQNYLSKTAYVLRDAWYDHEQGVHHANLLHADVKSLIRAVGPPGVFTVEAHSLKYRARIVQREVPQHVVHIPFLWYAGALKSPLITVAEVLEEKGDMVHRFFFTQLRSSLPYLATARPITWWHPLVPAVSFFALLPIAKKVIAALGGSGIGVPENPSNRAAFHGEVPLIQISSTGILLMSTSGKKVQAALDLVMELLSTAMVQMPATGTFQSLFVPAKAVAPPPKPTPARSKKGQKGKKGKKKGKNKGSSQPASVPKSTEPILAIPGAVIEKEQVSFVAPGITFEPFDQEQVERELVLDEISAPFMDDPLLEQQDESLCTVCDESHPPVAQKYT